MKLTGEDPYNSSSKIRHLKILKNKKWGAVHKKMSSREGSHAFLNDICYLKLKLQIYFPAFFT